MPRLDARLLPCMVHWLQVRMITGRTVEISMIPADRESRLWKGR
jgi:hypothetical protein